MNLSISTLQFTDLIVFATCGIVLVCCWLLQREKTFFLPFGASFLLCAVMSVGFTDFGFYGSWLSPLGWSFAGSLFWMGFRVFDGRRPLTPAMLLLTLTPTILHLAMTGAGVAADTVNVATTLAYALHEAAVAAYVLSTAGRSIIRRVAGYALAAIVVAICAPLPNLSPSLEHLSLIFIVIVDHVTSIVLITAILALEAERAYAALQDVAHRDPLTGALNREGIARDLRTLRGSAGVVLADLDHFKIVNDRFGHAAGDRALQGFVQRAFAVLPKGALLARYGGEEFVIVLPGLDDKATAFIAERLRYAIQTKPVRWNDQAIPLTVSVGVAMTEDLSRLDMTLKRADAALYAAKNAGRNRVQVA